MKFWIGIFSATQNISYKNLHFSNTGAEAILKHTLTHARQQIDLKEMEQIIQKAVSEAGKSK